MKNLEKNLKIAKFLFIYIEKIVFACETLTMTETIAKKLLKIVDRLMDQHFFQTNGLRQLGWCAYYMLDRTSLDYYNQDTKEFLWKTEVTEFYLVNNSPNRAFKRQLVTEAKVCNCMYCRFFMFWFLENKIKMTFTNTKPMSFGKFFNLCYKYWDLASKRGTEYSALEVLLFFLCI